jgi:hypothetical protein
LYLLVFSYYLPPWILSSNFTFQGYLLEDLWLIDSCIPLKDKFLVELVRSVVCWVIWLERNSIIFNQSSPVSYRALGLKIINLATFWCKARNASQLYKLTLILPQGIELLPLQIEAEEDTEGDLVPIVGCTPLRYG